MRDIGEGTAEWDLNDENLIPINTVEEAGSEYTAWIVVAADFYYLTGVPINTVLTDKYGKRLNRDQPKEMGEMNIGKIAERYKAMSNALFKMKWLKSANRRWLTAAGLGNTGDGHLRRVCLGNLGLGGDNLGNGQLNALPGKLKVRRPEKVNQVIFAIASQQLRNPRERVGRLEIKWPDMGVLSWKESRKRDRPVRAPCPEWDRLEETKPQYMARMKKKRQEEDEQEAERMRRKQ